MFYTILCIVIFVIKFKGWIENWKNGNNQVKNYFCFIHVDCQAGWNPWNRPPTYNHTAPSYNHTVPRYNNSYRVSTQYWIQTFKSNRIMLYFESGLIEIYSAATIPEINQVPAIWIASRYTRCKYSSEWISIDFCCVECKSIDLNNNRNIFNVLCS